MHYSAWFVLYMFLVDTTGKAVYAENCTASLTSFKSCLRGGKEFLLQCHKLFGRHALGIGLCTLSLLHHKHITLGNQAGIPFETA